MLPIPESPLRQSEVVKVSRLLPETPYLIPCKKKSAFHATPIWIECVPPQKLEEARYAVGRFLLQFTSVELVRPDAIFTTEMSTAMILLFPRL
jgi:hypothetical protein